jgi:threonyl-tRNA synthetase
MSDLTDLQKHTDPLDVLRHSTAHVLAAAVTDLFPGTRYAYGPPVEDGFYYDFDVEHRLSEEDLPAIEARMRDLIAADAPFKHQTLAREDALAEFKARSQDFKLLTIESKVEGPDVSVYRTGDFLDLCVGPHVASTGEIKAFKLLRVSGAYWLGDEKNQQLQRVYGTAWRSQEELDDYLRFLQQAEARDHKKLGRELKLFLLDERTGAGNVIWLPAGMTIRRQLERWVIDEEVARGYQHVKTPDIAKRSLFVQSGHTELYSDSMFPPIRFPDGGEELQLRPVNCPHHILIYQSELRSYRELPLRIAEIGNMYRYEKSGELMGMIRVRIIALSDAHIFCTPDQLHEEIVEAIKLSLHFMDVLGVTDFKYRLSVRDEDSAKWLGTPEQWQPAQAALAEALESLGQPYELGVGEAAFYGPKIDFQVRDAMRREFTNSTVQVDFQLPERFDLEYVASDGKRHRPVMVHRGAFGAFERMTAYLTEHYAGAFPTWLHPVQVIVANLNDASLDYARRVVQALRDRGLRVELDDRNESVGRKKVSAIASKVPYFVVVGPRDEAAGKVSVRNRADEQTVEDLDAFAARVEAEVASKAR